MFIFFHLAHAYIVIIWTGYEQYIIKMVCRPYKLVNQTLCNFFNIFITFLFLSSLNQRKKGNFLKNIYPCCDGEYDILTPIYRLWEGWKNITDQFGIVGLLNPANHGIRVATVIEFSVGLFLCLFVLLLHFY